MRNILIIFTLLLSGTIFCQTVGTVNGVSASNVGTINGVDAANIGQVNGVDWPAGGSYLLDTYTGAGVAYALFKLTSTPPTYCMTVYRDSDGTTQDIGWDGDWVDTSAIKTFCSGTTGRVITLYDHSGNGYDLVYVSGTRAIIYEAGAIYRLNGTPAVKNVNTGGVLQATSVSGADLVGVNEAYIILAGSKTSNLTFSATPPIYIRLVDGFSSFITNTSGNSYTYNTTQTYTAGVQYIGEGLYVDGVTSPDLYVNGTLLVEAFGSAGSYTGSGSVGLQAIGNLQVAVVWPFDQSSNRSDIYTIIYNALNP